MSISLGPKVVFLSILWLYITTLFFSQKPKSWKYTNLTSCRDPIFLQYQMITTSLNNDCLSCIGLTYKGQYRYILYFFSESFKLPFLLYMFWMLTKNNIFFSFLCKEHWMLQQFCCFLLTDMGMRLSSILGFIWSVCWLSL